MKNRECTMDLVGSVGITVIIMRVHIIWRLAINVRYELTHFDDINSLKRTLCVWQVNVTR